jgi:hypothetical protein
MDKTHTNFFLKGMAEKWPSTLVVRNEIGKFTGGILQPRTMANLDSVGKGPEGRFRFGRKVAYPVDSVIRFLRERQNDSVVKSPFSHKENNHE